MKQIIKDESEMAELAKKFSQEICSGGVERVVGLEGELGSGKTTFVRRVLSELGVESGVVSPTFVLVREYPLKNRSYKKAYHLDLYRLKTPGEIFDLGLPEILEDKEALVFIEWADKIKDELPKNITWLLFEHGQTESAREVTRR